MGQGRRPHLAAEEPWAQKCGGQAGRNDSFSQHVLHFPAEADVDGETTERHTTRPESRPSAHASQSLAEEKHYCHVALIRDTQHLNIFPIHWKPKFQSLSLESRAPQRYAIPS